jgi:hypothetical protein
MESFQQAIRKPVLYRPANFNDLWQHNPMITAGTYPPINIDLGNDEPGMTLQYRDFERRHIVWRDYQVDGEVVKSPVDIDALPGVYRLA